MIHTNLFSNIRISGAFLGPLTMLMLTCFHTILISVNHSNQIIPHRFQSTVSFWGSDQGLDKGRKRHICKKRGKFQITVNWELQIRQPPKPRSKSKCAQIHAVITMSSKVQTIVLCLSVLNVFGGGTQERSCNWSGLFFSYA